MHPLGLSERQILRFVVLPQAIRNVVPPLLNDFASLQKDTALISTLGVVALVARESIVAVVAVQRVIAAASGDDIPAVAAMMLKSAMSVEDVLARSATET